MMRIIYNRQFEGNTPFGMLMHKHATLCDACQAVRNRRDFLRQQIHDKKGKILSVAAGPAMGMLDFAQAIPEREIRNIEVLEEPLGINYFLKIDKAG